MTAADRPTRRAFVYALWFGMVMGFGEAALFFCWQLAGEPMYVTADIVWAAVFFDTLVCLLATGAVLVVARFAPATLDHLPLVLSFLLFVSWVAVAGHDRLYTWVFPIVAGGLAAATTRWLAQAQRRLHRVVFRTLPFVCVVAVGSSLAVPVARYVRRERAEAALPPPVPASPPNVLILLIDTFRADHSSAYGYSRPTTPHIDQLAREGVLFEHAYATSSYTLASHASILTGLFPHQHGAQWDVPLGFRRCDCLTLGAALQEHGYVTAGFSSNPFWFTREHGFGKGFLVFDDYFHSFVDSFMRTAFGRAVEQLVLPRLGYRDIPGRKRANVVNRRVLRWIDGRDGRPFFAFVNYFDIHDPYLPPEPYRSRFAGKPVGGIVNWRLNGLDPRLDDAVVKDEMDAYDGAITYVDDNIGALLDSLDARGVLQNTVVVVTSDHGEEFNEHGHMLHGHSLYTQATHVPLVLWNPSLVPAGRRVPETVSNVAVPSTIMDLVAGDADAFPWASLLDDDLGGSERAPALGGLVLKPWGPPDFPTFYGGMQSIVDGRWHYIRHEVFGPQLYDLDTDSEELSDLAGDPDHAALVDSLDARIDSLWMAR